MSVEQASGLRQSFTDSSVKYVVSKNTLTKLAAEKAGLSKDVFDEFLSGQIAIAYPGEDPTAPARVIKELDPSIDGVTRMKLFEDPESLANLYDQIDLYTLKENTFINYLKSNFFRNKRH